MSFEIVATKAFIKELENVTDKDLEDRIAALFDEE